MTPAELAEMEALCFPETPVTWSVSDYGQHLENPHSITIAGDMGFIIGRIIEDEAEVITLGVLPEHRHAGHGTDLLATFQIKAKQKGASVAFLEVSAENEAALALYKSAGFDRVGRRRKYYANAKGIAVDAFILKKTL